MPGEVLERRRQREGVDGPGAFLAQLAADWEAAANTAAAAGMRVVSLRMGMVLAPGGALSRLVPVFRLGLGGRLRPGERRARTR